MGKLVRHGLLLALLCLAGVQAAELGAEKRQAIQTLIDTLNLKAMGPQMMQQLAGQGEAIMRQTAQGLIDANAELSEAQRAEARQMLERELPGLAMELNVSLAKLDLSPIVNEVIFSVYGKHFETTEIRDMTAFYRSPTGRKVLRLLPQVTQESMQLSMERIAPLAEEAARKTVLRWQEGRKGAGRI